MDNSTGGLGEDFYERLLQDIAELESDLGLKKDETFILRLGNDKSQNDWTVFVKLSAYFETMLSFLLSERLSETLIDVFTHMPMADQKAGKIAVAAKLGFFSEDFGRLYLQALSEVRNMYAHRVANMELSLVELNDKYPKRIRMGHLLGPDHENERDPAQVRTYVIANAAVTQLQLITARWKTRIQKQNLDQNQKAADLLMHITSPVGRK